MSDRDNTQGGVSLADAVETLATIADLNIDAGIDPEYDLVLKNPKLGSIRWSHQTHGKITLGILREVFQVILDHFKNFYEQQSSYTSDERSVEGIKKIMRLVGEAAKKLDRLTNLFHQVKYKAITDLKEYRQLEDFYRTYIAKKVDEGTLSRWIMGLSERAFAIPESPVQPGKKMQIQHVFIDLEGVKKDTEYELFFIRKSDGSRFFSPRLIRNIKLVSDFGNYFQGSKSDDPLIDHNFLIDRCIQKGAKNIERKIYPLMMHFFKSAANERTSGLTELLRKACMALMLASASQNLLKNEPGKECSEYFHDFQSFLRKALNSQEYRNLAMKEGHPAVELTRAMCHALHVAMHGYQDAAGFIQNLVHEAVTELPSDYLEPKRQDRSLAGRLEMEYIAVAKLLKRHPNGSLNKIVQAIEEGAYRFFDPLWQKNFPSALFNLYVGEHKIVDLRLPAPVFQEFVDKAVVTEEFTAFMDGLNANQEGRKFLLLNFQDRTSWREHARTAALEALNEQFPDRLAVITLPKDTEFYHQQMPYTLENHADAFMEAFRDQLGDTNSGFYFPEKIHSLLMTGFIHGAMDAVHRIFFNSKNVLMKEQRLDFIEIFYFFLELKLLDSVQPQTVGFTCKDAVDTAGAANAQLFSFLKLLDQGRLSESDMELLDQMIYTSPIMVRERLMNPERFNRFLSALRVFESTRESLGATAFQKKVQDAFGRYYTTPILTAKLLPIQPSEGDNYEL